MDPLAPPDFVAYNIIVKLFVKSRAISREMDKRNKKPDLIIGHGIIEG